MTIDVVLTTIVFLFPVFGTTGERHCLRGYPCASEYEHIRANPDEPSVSIDINVTTTDGLVLQLFANACKDLRTFDRFERLAAKAETVLKADPRLARIVASVTAETEVLIPTSYIIQKLVRNESLDEDEERCMRNAIWNLGFEDDDAMAHYDFDLGNPVHRGILITLMTYADNDPIEPFYPLQNHAEYPRFTYMMQRWSLALQRSLNDSKRSDDRLGVRAQRFKPVDTGPGGLGQIERR